MQEYKPSRVSLGSSTEFQFEPENVAFTLPNWQVWLGTKLGGRKGRFTSSTVNLPGKSVQQLGGSLHWKSCRYRQLEPKTHQGWAVGTQRHRTGSKRN